MPQLQRGTPWAAASVPPPRSVERQHLADCIGRLAEAVAQADRVETARQRINDRLFDQLEPAVRSAKRALEEAADASPELLVDAVLSGGIAEDASATARIALRQAEAAVEQARQARAMLGEEADRAQNAVTAARQDLDRAVSAVIAADPAKAAVITEFARCARRVLQCAQRLRMIGVNQIAEMAGLRLIIQVAPTVSGAVAFAPDPTWASALGALRDDADAKLPGLPADDGPAGDAAEAA